MMRALRSEIRDFVFERIKDLIPPPPTHRIGGGRPRVPDDVCFAGLFIRLITGAAWETVEILMDRRVSDTTLRARRDEWVAAGVFDELMRQAQARYDELVGYNLHHVTIDGSEQLAPCGGEGTGVGPAHRGRVGHKWSTGVDAAGLVLGFTIDAANRNDYKLLRPTLDAVLANPAVDRINTLHLDRGYGYASVHEHLDGYPIDTLDVVPRRRPNEGRVPLVGFGSRWVVERTHSWFTNFGQLRRNTDRKSAHRNAAIAFAIAILTTYRIIDALATQPAIR